MSLASSIKNLDDCADVFVCQSLAHGGRYQVDVGQGIGNRDIYLVGGIGDVFEHFTYGSDGRLRREILFNDLFCLDGEDIVSQWDFLNAFFSMVREYDPDCFIGWNLIGFDLNWLSRKCTDLGIKFDIGTDRPADVLKPGQNFNQWITRIPARAALDRINMARSAYVKVDD